MVGHLLVALSVGGAALGAPHAGFDPVAETQKLLAAVPAAQRMRSDAYFEGGYWLLLWSPLVAAVLTWALYRLGVIAWLRDRVERISRRRFLQAVCSIVAMLTLFWIVELPWDAYTGFIREHQYGLSTQTFGAWLTDSARQLIVSLILLGPIGALLLAAIRRWPRRWWVMASVATPVLVGLLLVISPVFIAPLFNTYKPLTDARVRDPILSLARANGVPVDNVYQFDASRQSTRVSANVSGAFSTIRVSLNDNLLNRCTPAEVQAVMAHELGHYVLNHVYKLTIYISLLVAVGLAFTNWAHGKACARWGRRWGVRGPDDVAGLPLLLVVLSVFFLLATPVSNTITRTTEAEADIFGLNAARQPDGFAQVTLKLAEYRKLAPGPLEEFLFYDHPSGYHRVLMAMRWKAEHLAD